MKAQTPSTGLCVEYSSLQANHANGKEKVEKCSLSKTVLFAIDRFSVIHLYNLGYFTIIGQGSN